MALLLLGCHGAAPPAGDDDADASAPDAAAPPDAGSSDLEPCPEPLKQDLFPEYQVDIDAAEWAAMEEEFVDWQARSDAGLDPHPYHHVVLRYQGVEVPNVLMRLKGNGSWHETVANDPDPKMQFVLAFNEIDPEGRFYGMRKVDLDMPRLDLSFLRQRLALRALRAMGIPAQCANSARLVINGEYYGLYTNLERQDKEFLQRQFGDDDEGDLWKGGFQLETNEDMEDRDRLQAFWTATTVDELVTLADIEASVREWAAEAVVPQGDGYYFARPNFFLYDHPTRGFVWLITDLDSSLDYRAYDTSPLTPVADPDPLLRQHWSMVLGDPGWLQRYVDDLDELLALYQPDELEDLVDQWSAQTEASALADPHRAFSDAKYHAAVLGLRGYPERRAAYLREWIDCRRAGEPGCD
jgi:hypothetical protein